MPVPSNQEPRSRPPRDDDEPSWPEKAAEKVAEILRRIFIPGAQPEPVLVPVYVPRPGVRRRG
jgi:hypothetical protein